MNRKILIIIAILLIAIFVLTTMSIFSKDSDNEKSLEKITTSKDLENNYQISFYRSGKAVFKVILDGKEVSSIEGPEKESTSFLLPVEAGDHELEIVVSPITESEESVTYAYDLYEFPKGGDQYQIFEDKYKIATTTKSGGITGFIRETIQNKQIKLLIPFTAK